MQEDALKNEKDPAGHISHLAAPEPLYVPAEHTEQEVDPDVLE